MADITASMVKELREKSGAGMMDAKKALVENGGDMDAAVDWLRTKGLAKAEKKSGRTAAEGLVAVAVDGTKGAALEINAETDFVARNEQFQAFVTKAAQIALTVNTIEELAAEDMGGKSVQDTLTDLIATIGENMSLRRLDKVEVSSGVIGAYVHGALADGLGKIGVLVALEGGSDEESAKKIAMHVAAANPQFLDRESVDQAAMERERNVLIEQAKAEGKPEEIAQKMVEGRMRKYYEEVCLLEQTFVMDGESKIAAVVGDAKLAKFVRMQLGEGIEKEEEDFAAEVAKVASA